MKHPGGTVLPDRGDGLHWLRCYVCGREWAEKDSGAYVKGSRVCAGEKPHMASQEEGR